MKPITKTMHTKRLTSQQILRNQILRRAPGLFLLHSGVSGITVGQTDSHRNTKHSTEQTGEQAPCFILSGQVGSRWSDVQVFNIPIRSLLSRLEVHHKPRAPGGETCKESRLRIPATAVSSPREDLGHGSEDTGQKPSSHQENKSQGPQGLTTTWPPSMQTDKNLKYFSNLQQALQEPRPPPPSEEPRQQSVVGAGGQGD